jgi:hypothetical protein
MQSSSAPKPAAPGSIPFPKFVKWRHSACIRNIGSNGAPSPVASLGVRDEIIGGWTTKLSRDGRAGDKKLRHKR